MATANTNTQHNVSYSYIDVQSQYAMSLVMAWFAETNELMGDEPTTFQEICGFHNTVGGSAKYNDLDVSIALREDGFYVDVWYEGEFYFTPLVAYETVTSDDPNHYQECDLYDIHLDDITEALGTIEATHHILISY